MDKFLSELKLQNLLRQFCCGVVFFVPLYLFVPCKIQWVWQNAGLADDSLKCIAVLAFIIGTVIYHLEKNLYSYAVQAVFEKSQGKNVGRCLWVLGCVLFIVLLFYTFWNRDISWALYAMIIVCCVWTLLSLSVFAFTDIVLKSTQKQWEIESHSKNYTARYWAIADKVAVWSDFIHCVQSCCFAWLLGAGVALRITQQCGCCASEKNIIDSCFIAICLIIIELGIDWHRYRHVLSLNQAMNNSNEKRLVYIRMTVNYKKKSSINKSLINRLFPKCR